MYIHMLPGVTTLYLLDEAVKKWSNVIKHQVYNSILPVKLVKSYFSLNGEVTDQKSCFSLDGSVTEQSPYELERDYAF